MSPIYLEDMHVHSTFSDGRGSVAENIAVAASRGLTRFCCVDHVREDTMWVPAFVAEVARCSLGRSMSVYAGIEAKILDDEGTLDAPPEVDWVDFVYAADHQVPWRGGCRKPQDVRRDVQLGKVTRIRVIETLVEATARVLERYDVATLLAFRLATGRTHQIRVHSTHIGRPLIGDRTYGGGRPQAISHEKKHRGIYVSRLITRQALHARLLGFEHPRTGQFMEFEAEVPADMERLIEGLGG